MALHAFLGASEPLTRLGAGRVLIDTVLGQRRDDVRTALAAGCSWLEIAEALDDSELGVLLDHHLVADPEATHQ